MIIYIDLLFLEYFIINYLLIEITGRTLKIKSTFLKKSVSSLVVTIYSIVATITKSQILSATIFKLLLAALAICISFKPTTFSDGIKYILVFYVITYFIGGIASSIINTIPVEQICVLIAIAMSYLLIMIMKKILRNSNYICDLKIKINERYVMTKALIDTGHNLNDLITGDTVIIVNENVIREISEELLYVLEGKTLVIPEKYKTKIRMITYSSVGGEGVLMGVRCENVSLYYSGKKIENKNVVVALSKQRIKKVDALIGINLIEGGNVIGNSFVVKANS